MVITLKRKTVHIQASAGQEQNAESGDKRRQGRDAEWVRCVHALTAKACEFSLQDDGASTHQLTCQLHMMQLCMMSSIQGLTT